ncbi:hypothetical protein T552_00402 [Pneumocystis carinii B80]|uniref:UvrD-like helicase ATP-binding domain-containing protein n=1 Tax=Pneumocystis carinii (strain B80) TaxID=1408658 RepID=A0A0W4ZQQ7_PNEC8|nr:hypothetical protein T552_00402 [Pneumocystis carinii B80]KTW30689.1 hypothetical protein T552_00402 [Pneumocystis carinii B80]
MSIDEAGLLRVQELIEESYKNLEDTSIQQKAFQESLKYLGGLCEDEHWFCSNKLDALIKESLQLFMFSKSDALSWLKRKIRDQVGRCYSCVKHYHILKDEIETSYEGHEYDLDRSIHNYIKHLREFDYERIYEALNEWSDEILLEKKEMTINFRKFIVIYECLWDVELLKKDELKDKFKNIFLAIQKKNKFLRIYDEVVPAMVYFLFDEKFEDFYSWAEVSLKKLSRKLNSFEFSSIAKKPFTIAMDNYLKTNNSMPEMSTSIFWKGVSILFHYTEKESIIVDLSGQGWDIVGLTCSRFFENTPVILDILNAFLTLLNVLGSTFWEQAMYCNPLNAIDTICQNNYVHKMIKTSDMSNSQMDESSFMSFILPFMWVKPFINSLQDSNRHHSCSRFMLYFLEYFQQDEYSKENRDNCKAFAYQILSMAFEILLKSAFMDFDAYLILIQENKKVFEKYLGIVEESLFSIQTNDFVKAEACRLIGFVLKVDCKILQQEFSNIMKKSEKYDDSVMTITNYTLGRIWDVLIQNIRDCDLDIMSQIFQSLSSLSCIEIIQEESERFVYFNKIAMELILKAVQLFRKFDEMGSNIFKTMLQVPEINHSIISLSFSPIIEIGQLSSNIIKQAYNCVDQYEIFRFSLSHNFVSTLAGLINVIDNFENIQSFSVASQLIKAFIEVLDILCSPKNGILLLDQYKSKEYRPVIILLWSQFWMFLKMSFLFSLSWANDFPKDSMVVFIRDVLKMVSNMVNYSKVHDSIILLDDGDSDEPSHMLHKLFFQIQDCLKYSFRWLRLSDKELLISTVDFICLLLFRLKVGNIAIEESVLAILRDFLEKKSSKTSLTNEQKMKLSFALQEFELMLDKFNDVKVFESPILSQKLPCNNPDICVGNVERKTSDISHSKSFESGSLSNFTSGTKPKVQTKLVMEVLNSKAVLPSHESESNLNKYNLKNPSYSKNKSLNSHGLGFKSSSIRQFRLELLRDRKINRELKKCTKTSTNTTGSKLFESETPPDDIKDRDLEELVSSDTESENSNIDNLPLKGKISPKIRQIKRKSVQRLDHDILGSSLFSKQKLQKQKVNTSKMRLFPSLSPLHKQILQWNLNYNGEIPPGTIKQTYLEVDNKFQTPQAYVDTFEPLLLLECWQQIIKAKEENTDETFKIKIINRISVDEFIDLYVFISYEIFNSLVVLDSDILVISDVSNPFTESNAKLCLAKVQMISKKKNFVELTLRTCPLSKITTLFCPNNELYGLRLFSLVTIQREYSALKSLEYLELCDSIINARPQPFPLVSPAEIQYAMTTYDVNQPQAEAIVGVTKSTGFYLIQGPPGTGKTKTILGIINAFLSQSENRFRSGVTHENDPLSSRILVCAPSNAAVDEIVLRLKQGLPDSKGIKYYPKIVRVGSNTAVNFNVKDVTLDNLVEMELSKSNMKPEHDQNLNQETLKEQLNEILKRRDFLFMQLENQASEQEKKKIEIELKSLNLQKNNLGQQLDELRDQQNGTGKSLDIIRHEIQINILKSADVICTTLSASGYELLGNLAFDFFTVIIDEAAQCIELSTLIPLKYGCKRCVLVGDPNQLPPTVFSQVAANYLYEQSLFVRMQKNCPSSVHMLSIQYRMHPCISQFPSKIFYSNKLFDGENMREKAKRPWHKIDLFGPYRFFDIHGYEDEVFCSPFNLMEARIALIIYEAIIREFPSVNFNGCFGIITPYKQQLNKIKELFIKKYGNLIFENVDFNTVDGFQGQEKDIIILSCVRASTKGIGFLSDIRRMNVSLTRARSSLIILGNVKTLSCHSYWYSLIKDSKERGLLTKYDDMLFKTLKEKKNVDSCNFDMESQENYKIDSLGENISIQNFQLELIENTSCLKNSNSISENFQVFEEKVDKKAGFDSNFLIPSEKKPDVSLLIHKRRLDCDIFIRRPKIKKK